MRIRYTATGFLLDLVVLLLILIGVMFWIVQEPAQPKQQGCLPCTWGDHDSGPSDGNRIELKEDPDPE
jgi:hypothetical protein